MLTYRMHFIRCGSTSTEQPRRYVGQMNPPLCDQGRKQLSELKTKFIYPEADLVFSSPLKRCTQTAEILYPDQTAQTLDSLSDMSLGQFEGFSFEQLRGNADFAAWLEDSAKNPPPGGEPTPDFVLRLVGATRDMFMQMNSRRLQDAVVITHGGVIMSLLAAIALPKHALHEWAVPNGTGYTLTFTTQMWMRDGCAEVTGAVPFSEEQLPQ